MRFATRGACRGSVLSECGAVEAVKAPSAHFLPSPLLEGREFRIFLRLRAIPTPTNSQLHTRSGYCSLVSEHSSPQQRDAVEASESQLSSCCQRPSTSNADESRKSEHDTRRVLSSAPIVSSAARASDALRERQVFPQNMQSITRPPLRRS
eukprot:5820110-Prymnesium_polylepis.1